jgi:hypothetical protein
MDLEEGNSLSPFTMRVALMLLAAAGPTVFEWPLSGNMSSRGI